MPLKVTLKTLQERMLKGTLEKFVIFPQFSQEAR